MHVDVIHFESKSKEMKVESTGDIVICRVGNLKIATTAEFLSMLEYAGKALVKLQTGKVLADATRLSNYDIATRAAAIRALPDLLFNKSPYLLLGIVRAPNLFENLGIQASINLAKPLSKKFLDGKIFDTQDETLAWLKAFEVPKEFLNGSNTG